MILEYGNARMIRKDGYKLILRYTLEGVNFPNKLYDLMAEPREITNLYREPQHAPLIQSLTAEINEFLSKYAVLRAQRTRSGESTHCNTSEPLTASVRMQKRSKAKVESQ